MNELFGSEVQVKSPRLRWMERYSVKVTDFGEPGEDEFGEWERFGASGRVGLGMPKRVQGATEDEALANLALALKVLLWNEE